MKNIITSFKEFNESIDDNFIPVYFGGNITPLGNIYLNKDLDRAKYFALENDTEVEEFLIDKSKFADEEYVFQKVKDLGFTPREGYTIDETRINELLDSKFDMSLIEEQILIIFGELEKEGYLGICFLEEDIIQKNKLGVECYLVFNKEKLS